ncbi:hypothetical protein LZP73_11840 [Shewanella sp. AS16]|uniref:hypothetical protein n=1 Tax=Shewanella sp. AS16 TaxID=2907625 RepID=UPI001F159007|nr:hypothetical protein [Shewanella sp. AS16]MCE9686884.1 hypothetical protein [Shewanella sp. AS16]
MFKTGLLLSLCAALVLATPAMAAPSPLIIDKNVRPKSSNGRINAVHKEIPTMGADLNKVRYGILEGMLETKGFSWVYDGEGEGYILARFDYRGDTNVMRIEYDENYVQLKYQDALGDYVCEKLIEGICYKNGRGYYNYIKNLRKSIAYKIERL